MGVHVLALNAKTEMVGTHVVVQMRTNYINLMEIEVLGEAAPDTGNISPIEAKMSSLWPHYPASNCIDGNPNTMCRTGGVESYPWVTLVIPRSIVRGIRITNRNNCCRDRMKNMKIWVGNGLPSTTAVEYTGGALLGSFSGPGTNVHVLALNAKTEMVGTHVVVQMRTNYINLMEIEVLGEAALDTEDRYCGLAKRRPTRIQGGIETEVNEYPWQVLLKNGSSSICGGSLISDQWVLTAAHCVKYREWVAKESDLKVYLGEHDRTDTDEADTIQIDLAEIIIHEQYNPSDPSRFDFAILKLTNKIDFDSHPHIRPICLPADGSNKHYSGYTATATGWGRTSVNGYGSPHLLEVDLSVVTETECSQRVGGLHIEQVLCVKGDGENGVCRGDSGGPLITKDSGHSGTVPGQNYELIGVASFTTRGTCENTLQGFARVTAQLDWIREKTKDSWRTCPRT